MSIITNEVNRNTLSGVIGVAANRRNIDSSTNERRCITVTPEDLALYNSLFSYNSGKLSDGKTAYISGNSDEGVYTRIPINIHMVEQTVHPLEEAYISTAEDAAKRGENSLMVWVDGNKIPDNEIQFYPTRSNVDVFIPSKYFGDMNINHELIVEKKWFKTYPYIRYYAKGFTSQSFSILLTEKAKSFISSITNGITKNVQIFVDKKLYNYGRTVEFFNNHLNITLTTEITANEIEIEVDPYVVFYFPKTDTSQTTVSQNDNKNIFVIPESYIDSIHGPISRFSCAFYINGLRKMNSEVDQKGRLHFEYDTKDVSNNSVSFYLSDRNLIVDTDDIYYGSDYSLYNFVGCDAVTNALHTTLTGNKFLDEGANKYFKGLYVTKNIGESKVYIPLNEGVVFDTADPHQRLEVGFYVTKKISKTEDPTSDTVITWADPSDYGIEVIDGITNVVILSPSAYMADTYPTECEIRIKSWFSWDEVLNNDGTLFSREKYKELINMNNDPSNYIDVKVASMLDKRPYLMRTFLENYGYKIYQNDINYNGIDAYVYLSVPDTVEKGSGKNYDISINNFHIPISKVRIIDKDLTDVFEIEGKFFNKGINNVEIQIMDNLSVEYKRYNPSDITSDDGLSILHVDGFDHAGDIENNIIILERCNENTEGIYMFLTDAKSGYKIFDDFEIGPYDADDPNHSFSIIFNSIPSNEFLVYSKNFSRQIAYTKPAVQSVTDVIIPLYTGSQGDPIPYIPKGKIYVYCGNDKFIEGIDYFIKTPETDPTVSGSYIVMKRIVLPGSQVDIYLSNYRTTTVYNKTGYFENNRYGLFYLGDLNFPVSTDYLNIYINGKKMTSNDVDILSDKLIRIHSMKTPLYDLVIESAFTVDDWDLEPYINLYSPDNFELYLARLFLGANYSGSIDQETTYDINEVYESFIDTVDSVNKVPNPTSRDGIWIPSYNEFPDLIGPFNDGSVVDGEDINCSMVIGNAYIVGANKGKIASSIISNDLNKWDPFNSTEHTFSGSIFSDGTDLNGEDITSCILYHKYALFGTRNGNLYAYGTSNERWLDKNDFRALLDISNTWQEGVSINGFLIDQESDSLIMYGDRGTVDRFNWQRQRWAGTTQGIKQFDESVGVTGVMSDIRTAFIVKSSPYNILVVSGKDGEAASCYINCAVANGWVKSNSSAFDLNNGGLVPSIYSDGSYRNNMDVNTSCEFFNYRVLIGEDGTVTYFDGNNFINSDILHICNMDGSISGEFDIRDCVSVNEKMMILGGEAGKVSQYEGDTQTWNNCDSGKGITSYGSYMLGNAINTMVLTTGETNYIIFAGDNGKVCSYNIDVEDVPYRYDPYKSMFLEWYTTAGNAEIKGRWDIPIEISRKFDMVRESNVGTGDIILRSGDNDMMVPIDMTDHEAYPWSVKSRNRFIANFIKGLPGGPYTLDQIYSMYKNSQAKYMLYEKDLIMLAAGNDLDSENDIDITNVST